MKASKGNTLKIKKKVKGIFLKSCLTYLSLLQLRVVLYNILHWAQSPSLFLHFPSWKIELMQQ